MSISLNTNMQMALSKSQVRRQQRKHTHQCLLHGLQIARQGNAVLQVVRVVDLAAGELVDRLLAIAPGIQAQICAADAGCPQRTSSGLIHADQHVMGCAAKHNYDERFNNITPAKARKARRGGGQQGKQEDRATVEMGSSSGGQAEVEVVQRGTLPFLVRAPPPPPLSNFVLNPLAATFIMPDASERLGAQVAEEPAVQQAAVLGFLLDWHGPEPTNMALAKPVHAVQDTQDLAWSSNTEQTTVRSNLNSVVTQQLRPNKDPCEQGVSDVLDLITLARLAMVSWHCQSFVISLKGEVVPGRAFKLKRYIFNEVQQVIFRTEQELRDTSRGFSKRREERPQHKHTFDANGFMSVSRASNPDAAANSVAASSNPELPARPTVERCLTTAISSRR